MSNMNGNNLQNSDDTNKNITKRMFEIGVRAGGKVGQKIGMQTIKKSGKIIKKLIIQLTKDIVKAIMGDVVGLIKWFFAIGLILLIITIFIITSVFDQLRAIDQSFGEKTGDNVTSMTTEEVKYQLKNLDPDDSLFNGMIDQLQPERTQFFLEKDENSYSSDVLNYSIENAHVHIQSSYSSSTNSKGETTSSSSRSADLDISETPKQQYLKKIEETYSVPWQELSSLELYLGFDKQMEGSNADKTLEKAYKNMLSTYSYIFPKSVHLNNPIPSSKMFDDTTGTVTWDQPHNHKIERNNSLVVNLNSFPYMDEFEEKEYKDFLGYCNMWDMNMTKKTVHKSTSYSDGSSSSSTTTTIDVDVEKVNPTLRQNYISSDFVNVNYNYKRLTLPEKLIYSDTYSYSSGSTYTTVTIEKYQAYDKIALNNTSITDNSERYINMTKELKMNLEKYNEYIDLLSMYPAGDSIVAKIKGSDLAKHVNQIQLEDFVYDNDFTEPAVDLPKIEGTWTRNDLINVAERLLSLYGSGKPIHYFWNGKYYTLGINSKWGQLKYEPVWEKAYVPYGMDCSGFVSWLYNQMLIPQGSRLNTGSVNQINMCRMIPESELKKGDLAFNSPTVSSRSGGHVGIYYGKVNGKNAFIHLAGNQYAIGGYPAGRLVVTYNNTSEYLNGNPPSNFTQFGRLAHIKFKGDEENDEDYEY